jgi:radical SAM superfamily enzyme YgiQ (UPF0313 family)
VSAAVKEQYPDLPVIWGGYHPTTQPEQTLANPNIDIVVRGQGELTFKEVVKRLHSGETLDGVRGVSYKAGERIITNPDQGVSDEVISKMGCFTGGRVVTLVKSPKTFTVDAGPNSHNRQHRS